MRVNLEASENLEEEDRDLILRLSPLYLQRLEEARQKGEQQGMQTERRVLLENLLRFRYGLLDEPLAATIELWLLLPSEEFTLLLLQLSVLSREQLLARFGEQATESDQDTS